MDTISSDIQKNKDALKKTFDKCADAVFRELKVQTSGGKPIAGLLVYIEGIVKAEEISDFALRPLLQAKLQTDRPGRKLLAKPGSSFDRVEDQLLATSQLSEVSSMDKAVDAILDGNAVLFIDGSRQAIILKVKGGIRRSVEEPETEAVIRGPREGFTENIRVNTSLLRFRVKTPDLKMINYIIGERTKTNVVLAYIDGIILPGVLQEVQNRLDSIRMDGVLESGYIEELIMDSPYSPFPQIQYTERPDTIAAQLLEGNFAIFVDGTPFVLSGPVTLPQFLQASEDFYAGYLIANLLRWLRYLFLFVALFMPAIYVAILTYHPDMLPTSLILSIAAARESIPFPALVEALIMEVAFEALREAGIRLPKTVGQAVSILGALVIGQAAVEAGIVSAPMVIIVAITGIASFTFPRFNLAISIRMLRFPIMVLAGLFGLFGIVVGTMLISVHLCQLRSFGVPYLSGIAPMMNGEGKDIFVRAPWWRMTTRPGSTSRRPLGRMKSGMKPSPYRNNGDES